MVEIWVQSIVPAFEALVAGATAYICCNEDPFATVTCYRFAQTLVFIEKPHSSLDPATKIVLPLHLAVLLALSRLADSHWLLGRFRLCLPTTRGCISLLLSELRLLDIMPLNIPWSKQTFSFQCSWKAHFLGRRGIHKNIEEMKLVWGP